MTITTTRVGIIGAGASGMSALKWCLETWARDDVKRRDELQIVVFEKQDEVGGVWYDDGAPKRSWTEFDDDAHACVGGEEGTSPMYDGLRTNLPYALMSFRDHLFPSSTPLFPTAEQVQAYLISYADRFGLRPHIRFETTVKRLRKDGEEWVIESASPMDRGNDETNGAAGNGGVSGQRVERFDKIVVANGHYEEVHVPSIPGLSTFTGQITHSRFYRSPSDYIGKTVLVVGSFASGSDLSRQLASLNLDPLHPLTKVYVSSSGDTSYAGREGDWAKYIEDVPLITSIKGNEIVVQGAAEGEEEKRLSGVDVVIFATGYWYALPFCHVGDQPWNEVRVLSDVKNKEEGGIRGFHMDNLDSLQLFLANDRSIAFPTLQYQVVPFPLAETQARLLSLLWSSLLPSFPSDPTPPPNPSNPYSNGQHGQKPTRKVVGMRKEFVFGSPYEWTYEEYLMDLCLEASSGKTTPECWKRIEGWRRDLRADTGLRRKILGY